MGYNWANEQMKNISTVAYFVLFTMVILLCGCTGGTSAQSVGRNSLLGNGMNTDNGDEEVGEMCDTEITVEGFLSMYLVAEYGESIRKLDRYQKPSAEGEFVAFVLKTDEPLDMSRLAKVEDELDRELMTALVELGETLQSEFLMVRKFDSDVPFSGSDFAARYAHKRVRVTGSFFLPVAGWHYITPAALEYSRVEVVE